jgi:hypothetical protein
MYLVDVKRRSISSRDGEEEEVLGSEVGHVTDEVEHLVCA